MPLARSRISPAVFAVLIPAAAACAAGDSSTREWTGIRDTIDGVEIVRNPSAPLLADGTVAATELWAVDGNDETGGASVWERPASVRAYGGSVYVLDRMAGRVYRYSAEDGSLLATMGRKGEGPGEVAEPMAFAVRAGEIIIADAMSEMEVFDTLGTHVRSIRPNGIVFDVYPFGPDRLLVRLAQLTGESRWAILAPDRERRPLGPPAWTAEAPQDVPDCIREATSGPMILRAHCSMLRVQFIRDDGAPQRETTVDRRPEYSTEAELEAFAARARQDISRLGAPTDQVERAVRDLVEQRRVKQIFAGVRRDTETGHTWVWEQASEDFGGGPATLHLFDASGVYLARVTFERRWYDFDVVGDQIYALERDPDTDLATLVAYRVLIPSIEIVEDH